MNISYTYVHYLYVHVCIELLSQENNFSSSSHKQTHHMNTLKENAGKHTQKYI